MPTCWSRVCTEAGIEVFILFLTPPALYFVSGFDLLCMLLGQVLSDFRHTPHRPTIVVCAHVTRSLTSCPHQSLWGRHFPFSIPLRSRQSLLFSY